MTLRATTRNYSTPMFGPVHSTYAGSTLVSRPLHLHIFNTKPILWQIIDGFFTSIRLVASSFLATEGSIHACWYEWTNRKTPTQMRRHFRGELVLSGLLLTGEAFFNCMHLSTGVHGKAYGVYWEKSQGTDWLHLAFVSERLPIRFGRDGSFRNDSFLFLSIQDEEVPVRMGSAKLGGKKLLVLVWFHGFPFSLLAKTCFLSGIHPLA